MRSVMNAIARPWHPLMEIQHMKLFFFSFLALALLHGAVEAPMQKSSVPQKIIILCNHLWF